MPIERVIVEADGGARGNPGPAGYGAVVVDPETDVVLAERAESLGATTNNVAEYSGLIAGLEAAAELGARVVDVRLDSKLVVEQMSGRWKIKHPGLRPLAARAAELVRGFDSVTLRWVPRARNTRADRLANAAMDAAVTGAAPGAAPGTGGGSGADASGPTRAASGKAEPGTAPATRPSSDPTAAQEPPRNWLPPSSRATRLILVRHGETALSAERRFSGRGDPVLTTKGQAQALAAAARVSTLVGDAEAVVVSSPLSRARQTATEIAGVLGVPEVVVEDALVECDFGRWEGAGFADVRRAWPVRLDEWLGSTAVCPPDGESFDEVAARVGPAVGKLRDAYPGKVIVIVSHVTVIKLILRDALDGGRRFLHQLHLDPASVSVVDTWPDAGVSVRLVNDTSHLGDLAT
jgi:probable phosphoglycerate mutase